jgi:hypothetical protein
MADKGYRQTLANSIGGTTTGSTGSNGSKRELNGAQHYRRSDKMTGK